MSVFLKMAPQKKSKNKKWPPFVATSATVCDVRSTLRVYVQVNCAAFFGF